MRKKFSKDFTPFALEIKNISKFYPGVVALNNISINLEWGTIHGIAGENGSGKSTLLRIISGMEKPDQGEVTMKASLRRNLISFFCKMWQWLHKNLH